MEYVSVLAGLRFTDRPRCTHPLLGWLARRVNDAVGDDARTRLVIVAPALIGTRRRRREVRAVIYQRIAWAGLTAAPGDPWLVGLEARTHQHLTQHVLARPDLGRTSHQSRQYGPARPARESGERTGARPRRWAPPLPMLDRNTAFAHLEDALDSLEPDRRDQLLLELLDTGVRDARRCLGLPSLPATSTVTSTST